jgi:3',5'-cyclic AMP phosphodiesterase CpdA
MSKLRATLYLCLFAFVGLAWFFHQDSDAQRSLKLTAAKAADGRIVIAHLSDTHLGLGRAPGTEQRMKKAIDMINRIEPDAVILTGDVAERREGSVEAKNLLNRLNAKFYVIPGNHDVHDDDMSRHQGVFGDDYYTFDIGHVRFLALNSQLMGNYDKYEARSPMDLSENGKQQSRRMFQWLSEIDDDDKVTVAMQHIPLARAGDFPKDPRPYWTVHPKYRERVVDQLKRLGVQHIFAGHWHRGMDFSVQGIEHHLAPATSWSPFNAPLGFAVHTIDRNGNVSTEYKTIE